MENLAIIAIITVILMFLFRLFGAWMLRINEVIENTKITNEVLEEINKKLK